MEDKYNDQIAQYEKLLSRKQKQFSLWGNLRLLLLALLVGCGVFVVTSRACAVAVVLFCLLAAAMLGATFVHLRTHEAVRLYAGLILINRQYLARIRGEIDAFKDDGGQHLPASHHYARDLDILGPSSLYQLINVTGSCYGQMQFVQDLLHSEYAAADIAQRQQAIEELAAKTDFAARLQYHTGQIKSDAGTQHTVRALASTQYILRSAAVRRAVLVVPLLVAALATVAVVFGLRFLYIPAALLLVAQGVVWVLGLGRNKNLAGPVVGAPHLFRHYSRVFAAIAQEQFTSPLLVQLQQKLATGQQNAGEALRELDAIVSRVRLRNSPVFYFIMNVLVLWDYRIAARLSAWKLRYAAVCEEWFYALGNLESLLCFAVLPNVCTTTCTPIIQTGRPVLKAQGLGHPLIPNRQRVLNNFETQGEMYIISGSNMSGKTTFLRSVGINLILARAGAHVCAQNMECSLFCPLTSMRVADSLQEGISTFYAELARIRDIVQAARTRQNLFFLIDEIFRGTNSEDRLFGARAVIAELAQRRSMGLITTHDLSLGSMAEEYPNIHNANFSETYENDEMEFDYKLRAGVAKTTNARFLMRKIGLLDGLQQDF